MNFGQYLAALAAAWAAFESGSPESFKVGSVTVTAKLGAQANHLTLGQLISAALLALEGKTGVVQVGDVEFDMTG